MNYSLQSTGNSSLKTPDTKSSYIASVMTLQAKSWITGITVCEKVTFNWKLSDNIREATNSLLSRPIISEDVVKPPGRYTVWSLEAICDRETGCLGVEFEFLWYLNSDAPLDNSGTTTTWLTSTIHVGSVEGGLTYAGSLKNFLFSNLGEKRKVTTNHRLDSDR